MLRALGLADAILIPAGAFAQTLPPVPAQGTFYKSTRADDL